MESKIEANKITVIIRDDAPIIHSADCPTYRRVTFELTTEQKEAFRVRHTSTSDGVKIYESISKIFWET